LHGSSGQLFEQDSFCQSTGYHAAVEHENIKIGLHIQELQFGDHMPQAGAGD